MIETAMIMNHGGQDNVGRKENDYVFVEFDDGSFVALDEEQLKNAAVLAEKGCLNEQDI